jgi:hypothetical protein
MNYKAEIAALESLRYGRGPARDAGLKVFQSLLRCPIPRHGSIRRLSDSKCITCLETAGDIIKKAKQTGREIALKLARAEVAREQKAALKAAERAEAEATRAALKAERLKAKRAAERATRKAEREAASLALVGHNKGPGVAPAATPIDSTFLPPWD